MKKSTKITGVLTMFMVSAICMQAFGMGAGVSVANAQTHDDDDFDDDDDLECPCNDIPEYFAFIDDEVVLTDCFTRVDRQALFSDDGIVLVEAEFCLVQNSSVGFEASRNITTDEEFALCRADMDEAAEEQDLVCF